MARSSPDRPDATPLSLEDPQAAVEPAPVRGHWTLTVRVNSMRAIEARHGPAQGVIFSSAPVRATEAMAAQLQSLLADAEEPEGEAGSRPVPAALHRIANGLLEWRAELEAGDGATTFASLVLLDSVDAPAIVCVGADPPEITTEGCPFTPLWRILRGEGGTVARAAGLRPGRAGRLALTWSAGRKGHRKRSGSLEAKWVRDEPEAWNLGGLLAKIRGRLDPGGPGTEGVAGQAPSAAPEASPAGVAAPAPATEPVAAPAPSAEPAVEAPATAGAFGKIWIPLPGLLRSAAEPVEPPLVAAPAADVTPASEVTATPDVAPASIEQAEPEPAMLRVVDDEAAPVEDPDAPVAAEPSTRAAAWPFARFGWPGPVTVPALPRPAWRLPTLKPLIQQVRDQGSRTWNRLRDGFSNRLWNPLAGWFASRPWTRLAVRLPARPSMRLPKLAAPSMRLPKLPERSWGRLGRGLSERVWTPLVDGLSRVSPRLEDLWQVMAALGSQARFWALAVVLGLLCFGVGWMIGGVKVGPSPTRVTTLSLTARALNLIRLGDASFVCAVTSVPDGARIRVDGKDLGVVTPADVELAPGEHRILLSMPQSGGETFKVTGRGGGHASIAPMLAGSIMIQSPRGAQPMNVALDGVPRGSTPVTIADVTPGLHVLQFSGPGLLPWERTVRVGIRRITEVTAQPIHSPSSGLIVVRSRLSGDAGEQPLAGATVWVDGRQRGRTPLTVELPYGPHSLRVAYRGWESGVQLIDLPGGNERYADFLIGGASDPTRLKLTAGSGASGQVVASMQGVRPREVASLWLHVLSRDGMWHRIAVPVRGVAGGVSGVLPFRGADSPSRTPYYVSAVRTTGEEYFTEVQNPGDRGARSQGRD